MTKFNPTQKPGALADSMRYRIAPWALADVAFSGGFEPRLQMNHIQRAIDSNPIERPMMELQRVLTDDRATNQKIATFLAKDEALGLTLINDKGAANKTWDLMSLHEFRHDSASFALVPSADLAARLRNFGARIGSSPEVQRAWERGLSVSIQRATAAQAGTRSPAWTRPGAVVPSAQHLTIAYSYAIVAHVVAIVRDITINENQDAVSVSGPVMEAAFNVALCITTGLFGYLQGGSEGEHQTTMSIPSVLRESGQQLHKVKVQEHQHHKEELQKNLISNIRCHKSLLDGSTWQDNNDSPSLLTNVARYLTEKPLLRHLLLTNSLASRLEPYTSQDGFDDPSWTLSTIPPLNVTYVLQHSEDSSTGLYMSPMCVSPLIDTVALCSITQDRKLCGSPLSGMVPWTAEALTLTDNLYTRGVEDLLRSATTLAERIWNIWDLLPGLYESGIDSVGIIDRRNPEGKGEIGFTVSQTYLSRFLEIIRDADIPHPSKLQRNTKGEFVCVITIPAAHKEDIPNNEGLEKRSATTIVRPPEFLDWLRGLGAEEREAVETRLDRIQSKGLGALGYTRGIGPGLSELKFKIGGGLRVYYTIHRTSSAPVLEIKGWGNKDSQQLDIDELR